MEYIEGKIYHGFKLERQEVIDDIKSTVRIFEHVKSGARLIHLENSDDDKLFSIGFRTTPSDSTGVAHILEHSVLCGSKKFKTKDPFSDMAKGSLHTFMNAMTYTDKTIYPVGSRNEKDFMNLMNVYLDAVLHPRIYENHNILRQEGWRYELDENNNIVYKGVVYSEMQGALSSPEETIINKIYSSLFPDTTYDNISGGDPEIIPNLTQEKFEEFHSKFYHPSNSYIYLYGDENLDECLKFIDEEFLCEFDRIPVPSSIDDAEEFNKIAEIRDTYSINDKEDENNKEFFALNFAYSKTSNALDYLTHKVLYNMFIESAASPIKRALLDAGIGESLVTGDDMNMDPTKEILMPIVVKNAAKGEEKEFKEVIYKTLNDLVVKGIDKDLLYSCINTVEFRLKEITRYKGLQYDELIMESWIYDGDPTEHLKYGKTLKYLKDHVEDGYFEEFIKKNLIDNKHCSLVVLSPERGLASKKSSELAQKLKEYKESLSKEQLEEIVSQTEELKKEQMRKDTEEDKNTLPKLELSEVDKNAEKVPQTVLKHKDITILNHDIFTGDIEYIDLLFDASSILEEELPYLSLLTDILGKINTDNKTYEELSKEVAKVTGGIKFEVSVYNKQNNFTQYIPKFRVSTKTVSENIEKSLELVSEILTSTKFNDFERIKEIIKETKSKMELSLLDNGNSFAVKKVCSMFNAGSKYVEEISGVTYFKFLSEIDKNFDNSKEQLCLKLSSIYNKLFNKKNLIVSFTGEENMNDTALENIDIVLDNLKEEHTVSKYIKADDVLQSQAFITSSNVQYVVKGYNIVKLGYKYSGKMLVLNNILDSEYYYPKVRLQGGAYGCYTFINRSGNMGVYSYRDSNLKRTLDVYKDTYKFLENLDLTKDDMERFIIGTIGQYFKPLTPKMKSDKAISDYISGTTYDDAQRERNEIFETTIEDIKGYAGLIKEIFNKDLCCVLGNEKVINNNKDLFDVIE